MKSISEMSLCKCGRAKWVCFLHLSKCPYRATRETHFAHCTGTNSHRHGRYIVGPSKPDDFHYHTSVVCVESFFGSGATQRERQHEKTAKGDARRAPRFSRIY
jgi:hypothetical protein